MINSYLNILKVLLLFISALVLVACSSSQHVPVVESSVIEKKPPANQRYVVQKGDTLYGIAQRYSLNYIRLAQANNIPAPYHIFPGDTLFLREAPRLATAPAVKPASKPTAKPAATKSAAAKPAPKPAENSVPYTQPGPWIWPVKGKIIKTFDNGLNKGVDVVAAIGTPIRSSKAGTVIYAGSQLKGYGNLIIVRHDARYLSAYAHNREIFVKEGQQVNQGDVIAELGMSGTQTPKLHFEIRQDGKPINPLGLLPK